jgi:ferric-chelate reductase
MDAITPSSVLVARQHIQDHDAAESVIHHWGYADRVVPCVNDPGSCTYLDVVYDAHDVGMVYTGILWASIGGILLIWALVRRALPPLSARYQQQTLAAAGEIEAGRRRPEGTVTRLRHALWAHLNRFFLTDMWRPVFGRTTRLQVTILAVFAGYLTIFSFCGIVYGIWITPVKANPGLYNTRSSLGPFSDRVGVLAYALTPLSVMLANRESLLSVLTGIPYQNFNFLHRWLGYIIVIQSVVHTIGWTVIEVKLYQPQPQVAQKWIVQLYMIWGVVAMILLLMLYVLSLPPVIRLTGYEFFRKAHYILALIYIGACIGHWEQLSCFLIPGILLWFFDRAARLARTFLMHYNFVDVAKRGFVAAHAAITTFPDPDQGDVVRLDFEHPHEAWHPGQHFYLCFSESSIFQSHPFTPLNAPETVNGRTKHSYIFRAKKGETKKVAQLAAKKIAAASPADGKTTPTTPVILTGPYGDAITRNVTPDANILCIAGGTGITYVLPALLSIKASEPARKLELVWVVRHARDADWVKPELDTLADMGVTVRIFATRDAASLSPSPEPSSDGAAGDDEKTASARVKNVRGPSSLRSSGVGHPDVALLVREFVESTEMGRTMVFASGPGGLMSDARAAVASQNSGSKVWKGDDKFNVDFIFDERMER